MGPLWQPREGLINAVIKRKRKRKFWDRAEVKIEHPSLEKTPPKTFMAHV
jgi:hypothetical protein